MLETTWGRVGDGNVVSVREGDDWREVGSYPDVTPEEALAFFTRKYDDLASQVSLLEARSKRGASASDIAKGAAALTETLTGAKAVGDLATLRTRLETLSGGLEELRAAEAAASQEEKAAALAARTSIVEKIEKLAAGKLENANFKKLQTEVDALFAEWQDQQKNGPKLPRAAGDELWKRFRAARATIDAARRKYFATLDSTQKSVKEAKTRLVAAAEALLPPKDGASLKYRALLEEWKKAGHAGKKIDDALWASFSAVGDAIYQARSAEIEAENAEFAGNLAEKEALLAGDGKAILAETDVEKARTLLRAFASKWEKAGKVPRNDIKRVEGEMRKIEAHVEQLGRDHWNRTDPAKIARAEGMSAQLNAAIAELEAELAAAEAKGDAAAVQKAREALDARKAWLSAIA